MIKSSLIALAILCTSAMAHDWKHSQYTPGEQQFLQEQKVPGTNSSCCSIYDGSFAEEDIRNGHYWVRWGDNKEWYPVPDEAVIQGPNKFGRPAVWWGKGEEGETYVRCFIPGAKV